MAGLVVISFQMATTSRESTSTSYRASSVQEGPTNSITAARIARLEQEVMDLKEELEVERANPGAYDKATMETQLKLAQNSNSELMKKNQRLKKFTQIQTQTMMSIAQEKTKRPSLWNWLA